jgi:hypothetical protein
MWHGDGGLYEAQAKVTTREQLMSFLDNLDLKFAGLQP